MALYEYFTADGDTGMLLGGPGIDKFFREEADELGNFDERLLTVSNPEELLDQDALILAAQGLHDRISTSRQS